jgi:Putative adhesin
MPATASTLPQEDTGMSTFKTPQPIAVTISLAVGDVWIIASDRSDTVVGVSPSDKSNESDMKAAELTRVEYSHGTLLVKAPKQRFSPFSFGKGGSIDVAIELPAGSQVQGDSGVADVRCVGRLGECRFTTGLGNIRLEHTGQLSVSTGTGSIAVDRVVGRTEVTGAGDIRVGEVDGSAVIKNLNGDTWLGEVTGDLRCKAANGNITVDRAHATIVAKTAKGDVRFGDVARGSVVLETAFGELEVGIRKGTSALLDVSSKFGSVLNSLAASDVPGPSDQTVEVRARTSFGDILVRRSDLPSSQENTHGKKEE